MLYLSTPSTPDICAAMSAGLIGCMTTPKQGNVIPAGAFYAADNGRFGEGWPGHAKWWSWLSDTVERYGTERCLWATAPDVPFDAVGTLVESTPWLEQIRSLGIPVAFAAQGGSEGAGLIPWDGFDVLFLAGGAQCKPCGYEGTGQKEHRSSNRIYCPHCGARIYEWKLSREAADLAYEAACRGKVIHMGRVNSAQRYGPDKNLPKVIAWSGVLKDRKWHGIDFPLFDMETV